MEGGGRREERAGRREEGGGRRTEDGGRRTEDGEGRFGGLEGGGVAYHSTVGVCGREIDRVMREGDVGDALLALLEGGDLLECHTRKNLDLSCTHT